MDKCLVCNGDLDKENGWLKLMDNGKDVALCQRCKDEYLNSPITFNDLCDKYKKIKETHEG